MHWRICRNGIAKLSIGRSPIHVFN
jgi:hypothetical protein